MYTFQSFVLVLIAWLCPLVSAVTQVLSTVIYTRYGDRVPIVLQGQPHVLTPLGAQQLYAAGSQFRQRYLTAQINDGSSTNIRGISPFQLEDNEISVLTTTEQFNVASAQAFMQGLYPPLDTITSDTTINGQSGLANGTDVKAPLGGYQYANIQAASPNDLSSIYVDGLRNCPAYTGAMMSYFNSTQYQTLNAGAQRLYQELRPNFLDSVLSPGAIGYFNAHNIYEYLDYAYTHNETVAGQLPIANLTAAQILADDWAFAMYGNTSAPGVVDDEPIRAIAGRTLATSVLLSFVQHLDQGGMDNKINLLFGGFEPMISFAALTGLTSPQNSIFFRTPEAASSFVFELVAVDDSNPSYPDLSNVYVRFYYQNGTDEYSSLVEYPLFARSPSQSMMSWGDFVDKIQEIYMPSAETWCDACGSINSFCGAYYSKTLSSQNSRRGGLQPAVAGVIGALVALLVAALIFGALMFFGGFRLRKQENRRRSGLAGFKGAEKLASDQDLTIPKNGAAVNVAAANMDGPRGHERTGSWELREQARQERAQFSGIDKHMPSSRPKRPSFEEDDIRINPYGTPVKPHDTV